MPTFSELQSTPDRFSIRNTYLNSRLIKKLIRISELQSYKEYTDYKPTRLIPIKDR